MPEGDSIHRLAAALRPALVGDPVVRLRLRTHGEIARLRGASIEAVQALGKNLLVVLAGGWVLHVHLGLRGRTRQWPTECAPARLPVSAPLVLVTPRTTFACLSAARADLVRAHDLRLEARLRRVGPDLLDPAVDLDEVVARATAAVHRERAIGDALLDQSIAAGIGNVYKSEVLFVCGLDPFTPLRALSPARVREVWSTARDLMRSNLGPGARATVGELRGDRRRPETSRHWVYRREGLPCLRCGAMIRRATQGDGARSTWFCPRCQPPDGGA